MRIDAHQHFWNFDPVRDSWITESMSVIRRDFLPAHLEPLLEQNGFDGCVAVQAGQSEEETGFLLQLAEENNFIKGVVGWVDLQAADIKERLQHFRQFKALKGFRHVLQGEAVRDLMLQPAFARGIQALQRYGFTYDILIFLDQLVYAKKLVSQFPDQRFVVDHLAKPYIRSGKIDEWRKDMQEVAVSENVYCKISGMVTEADWQNWTKEDIRPYMDVVVGAFGPGRILFGSDWPVCLLAADYRQVTDLVKDYFSSFSPTEQEQVLGQNAVEFYNL